MPEYISGDLRTKSKEAAEEAFQILNLICYTFHPELEAVEPIFKGTRYHIYLRKRREKNGVWRAEEAHFNGRNHKCFPPLTEKIGTRLEEYLTECYNNTTKQ